MKKYGNNVFKYEYKMMPLKKKNWNDAKEGQKV